MRILVLSHCWEPEDGVPQRRWSWLTRILVGEGHEVIVIAPHSNAMTFRRIVRQRGKGVSLSKDAEVGSSGETIFRSGFHVKGHSLTQKIFNQGAVAVSMLLASVALNFRDPRHKPHLIIGTVPALPTAIVTKIVAQCLNTPYIIDLRDAWPDLLRYSSEWNTGTGDRSLREKILSRGPLQLLTKLTGWGIESALHSASGIITTSISLAEHLGTKMQINSDSSGRTPKIETIRNVFPPTTDCETLQKKSHGENELRVLYAGTVGRAQKLENAVKAAELVQERGYSVKLRIVGDGASWHALQERISNVHPNVEIEHRVDTEELHSYYNWADSSLVHLTDWEPLSRTIPSKIYELMEMGLHISGVVDGEAADLIEGLNAGDVVPPESPETLSQMWIDLIEDRKRLAVPSVGKEWVKKQRNEIVPMAMRKIINDVLTQG